MRLRTLRILTFREIRASVRGRWFLVGAIAFALLAAAVSHLGMAGAARWGVSTLDRTSVALLNLVILFVPLLAMLLGVASFAGESEEGTLAYVVAQPVTRGEVFLGKILGLLAAMTLSLGIGFGAAAVLVGADGAVGTGTYLALAGGAWLIGLVMVALGALLATLTRSRVRALVAVIGAWLLLVFLCDFGILALAASQSVGPNALFGLAVANPLQAVKTLVTLFSSARLEVLGPVGVHAVRELGVEGLAAVLAGSVLAWTAAMGAFGFWMFRRENLT
jgi:Cu-processing system permease protein